MKVSSKNVLGALAAAFVVGGLLSACSTSKNPDGGSSSGSSSSGSTTCGAVASTCTVTSECCTGLTCTGGSCTAQCGAAGDSCSAAATCCSPLVCDATSNTCLTGNSSSSSGGSSSCPTSPALGGCITAANCAPPDLCVPASDGGGYCGAVTTQPSAVCTPNGQSCTATTVCCGGNCVGGKCAPRAACGVLGQGCNVAGDCCNNFKCVQGAGADNGSDAGVDDAGEDAGATDGGSVGTDAGPATDGGTTGTDAGPTPDAGTPPACTTPDAGTFTGTCQPSCGGYLGACDTTNGNADCCQDQGWTCFSIDGGTTAGVCYPAGLQDSSGNSLFCGGPCSTVVQCQLSTPCDPTATTDACASAGLVCDQQFSVCRDPSEGDSCLPGGPACQPLADSTITDLQCLPVPQKFGGANSGYGCFQPCALTDPGTGTGDCVDPQMQCLAVAGAGSGAECYFNVGCTTYFGACNSSAVGDGVCVPEIQQGTVFGVCFQATLTGGAPGSACNFNDNRQNGGFCDPTGFCLYGTCAANCNSGTAGSPGCAQDAGAGVAVGCADLFGQGVGSATDGAKAFGVCSVNCDFTSPTGGGCSTVDCTPEKCLPPAYFGFTDGPTGICVEAPPGMTPAVGQPCAQSETSVDTCGQGAMCLGNGITLPFTCVQLCTNVGSAGAPCNADQVCTGINFTGTPAAHEGYCSLPDGGLGG